MRRRRTWGARGFWRVEGPLLRWSPWELSAPPSVPDPCDAPPLRTFWIHSNGREALLPPAQVDRPKRDETADYWHRASVLARTELAARRAGCARAVATPPERVPEPPFVGERVTLTEEGYLRMTGRIHQAWAIRVPAALDRALDLRGE